MSDDREGALLAAGWTAAVVAAADPSRYRRGREYLRENAVNSLDVLPGQLIGLVQGSRAEAYEVVVAVRQIAREETVAARLIPASTDIDYDCSCPDWDEPCKHAVAVALAFGERLRMAPQELARLRFGSAAAAAPALPVVPRPDTGSLARARGHLSVVKTPKPSEPPPPDDDEVAAFLGTPGDIPDRLPVIEPLHIPSVTVGSVDVGAVVADALSWLSAAYRPERER